jgi:hypothetical protein
MHVRKLDTASVLPSVTCTHFAFVLAAIHIPARPVIPAPSSHTFLPARRARWAGFVEHREWREAWREVQWRGVQ